MQKLKVNTGSQENLSRQMHSVLYDYFFVDTPGRFTADQGDNKMLCITLV